MDDLGRSIRHIAEEIRAVQEELKKAGLLASPEAARARRWELARHFGSLYDRLLLLFQMQGHTPAMVSSQRHSRRLLVEAPRPD